MTKQSSSLTASQWVPHLPVSYQKFPPQHTEHTHLHLLINYFRYADDVLLIYDSQHSDVHSITRDFNSIHPNLQFTHEPEVNNAISYMDITIHKTPYNIKISIHRKPPFTDTIIPYTSNHPTLYKYAAIRFLYSRLNTYQLHTAEHRNEENIIHNNSFPTPPKAPSPTSPATRKTPD
jgi:hypothetical protein